STGAGIDVVGDEPLTARAKTVAALDADDAVPAVLVRFAPALSQRRWQRAHRGVELPLELGLRVEQAGAAEHVESVGRSRDRAVVGGDGERRCLDIERSVGGHARRKRQVALAYGGR